jgi:putative Mn2+ efflux pump MntP
MVAYVFAKYGRAFPRFEHLRTAVLAFALVAFVATGIAGAFGAFLNKYAPVRGGSVIVIMGEGQ